MKGKFFNFIKSFKFIIIFGLFGIIIGTTSGILIKKFLTPTVIDYSNININDFMINENDLLKRYKKSNESKYAKDFTHGELVYLAQYNYNNAENTYSYGKGQGLSSVVKQEIRSSQIKNKDQYYEESLSKSSLVTVCNRTYSNGDNVDLYKGSLNKIDEAPIYNEKNKTTYTKEDHYAYAGKYLSNNFIYIISNKTVLSSTLEEVDGKYQIKLSLDPKISVYFYVIQMKNISDLKSFPKFEHIDLTYTISKDLKIEELSVNEKYYALTKMGIGSNVINGITYKYFEEYKAIPSLDEAFNY